MLSVRNGARAAEFYRSAFGAVEVYRVEDPTGAVVARLSVDGADQGNSTLTGPMPEFFGVKLLTWHSWGQNMSRGSVTLEVDHEPLATARPPTNLGTSWPIR